MDPEDGNSSSPSGADDMAAPIPYIMRHTIDLTSLTAEEEKIIKDVLAKDAKISELLDSRISAINKEIQTIRKKGALTEKDKNQNVICARCKYKFWPIPIPFTDSGPRCIRCKFRVCKRCRIRQVNKTWLCSLCLKHRQKKVLSGDWLASGENCAGLVGSDLIRASFRDRDLNAEEEEELEEHEVEEQEVEEQEVEEEQKVEEEQEVEEKEEVDGVGEGVTEEERTEFRCSTPQYVVTKAAIHKRNQSDISRTSVNSSDGTIEARDDVDAVDHGKIPENHITSEVAAATAAEMEADNDNGDAGGAVHIDKAGNNANFTRASESLRDSDSGVTSSSHHSQSNTPEQRSLNNEKGVSQPNYSATDKTSVPAIAVTEETREEDDDIDDLFTKHRQDNSLLGSRSSLRDSRESLYSVYSNAEENYGNVPVTGEIQFHLTYDYQHNVLQVHIKQCKEIAAVDTKHNRSDPYVKTYLLPDKSRTSKRKTKIKRHTLNPAFDESLKYTLSKSELDSRTLWVAVWNSDRFGRNDFLGEVTIPLAYYKFDSSAPIWYLLQERAAPEDTALMTYKGDLYISMKYVPANKVETKKAATSKKSKSKGKAPSGLGEIHVLVKEAKNLTAMRGSSGSNPFCKGYLLPDKAHQSKQKTPVIKKSTNPEWQHILIFEGVDENLLEDHGVELTIWDYEKLSSNDFLGGVRLNLGVGTSKGKPVDWMDGKGEEIEIWQSMIDAPNEWVDAQLSLRSSMGSQNAK